MATEQTVTRTILAMSIIICMAGAVVLGCGLYIRFGSGMVGSDVVTLFSKIEYNGRVMYGAVLNVVGYFMLVAGGVLMALALFGLVTAWKKNRGCLVLYAILTALMILIQVTTAALWINLDAETDEWFKGELLSLLKQYQGDQTTHTDDISKGWNELFIEAQCCAVNAYVSSSDNDFINLPSVWWGSIATDFVPSSCCQGVTAGDMYDASWDSCTQLPEKYYTEGCYKVIQRFVKSFMIVLAVASSLLVIVEVVAIIAACVLRDKLKARVSTVRTKDLRPPPYVGIDAVMRKKTKA